MEKLCEYIKKMRKPYTDDKMVYDIIQYNHESMTLNKQRKILNRKIGKSIRNVKVYPENWHVHNEPFISFSYKNLNCNIGEYYGNHRDYLWVSIEQMIE
jgi:hypothetical protein